MAIIPGIKNFDIVKRSDFPLTLTFKDGNGNTLSLNGYTVAAQVWYVNRKVKFADWTVTYTNRATGTVDIALTDVQTASFIRDSVLYYDVLLTDGAGLKEYYLEGNINVSEGYTA